MSDITPETASPGAAASDPFGGVPEAPLARRVAARAVDVLAVLGNPWLVLFLCLAFVVPFIEFIPVAVPLVVLSCAGAVTMWLCARLPNGERLPAGSLVTGLTVLRTLDASRVVLAKDIEGPRRPTPRRVTIGRIGFACTALAALVTIGSCGWAAYTIVFESANQAAAEARRQAEEPEAQRLCDAFTAELLAGATDAGEQYVVESAAEALPRYRAHLAAARVTRFESSGYGQSGGDWEFMFAEVGGAPAAGTGPAQVSVLIQRRGEKLAVTQLTWQATAEEVSP